MILPKLASGYCLFKKHKEWPGYCKKLINKNLNSTETWWGWGALMPCDQSRAQQEEDRLFFPGKDSANKQPRTWFTLALPTSFYSLLKSSPSRAVGGTCM